MKIGFTGTMSVGKTTLVNALKELPEFKDYTFRTERSKYLSELGIPLNTDSSTLGQAVFLAERASELMQPNVITDRTVIDVMAFSEASKSMGDEDKQAFLQYASRLIKEYDIIFYIPPHGMEMEDNGVRETNEQYRTTIDNLIANNLITFKDDIKDFHTISGTTWERIDQIKEVLFS